MSPQPESRRSIGHTRKTFSEADIRRMFEMREEGRPDSDIAKRFGVSAAKVVTLIGKRQGRPSSWW